MCKARKFATDAAFAIGMGLILAFVATAVQASGQPEEVPPPSNNDALVDFINEQLETNRGLRERLRVLEARVPTVDAMQYTVVNMGPQWGLSPAIATDGDTHSLAVRLSRKGFNIGYQLSNHKEQSWVVGVGVLLRPD